MKQSSIDFLLDKFGDIIGDMNTTNEQDLMLMEIIKQAKTMHKEEHHKTFNQGLMSNFQNFDDYYNETFNPQPKIDELTQLRKLAVLLQSAWHHGNWKAETVNEREMEKIMTEQGYWPALLNPNQIGKMTSTDTASGIHLPKQLQNTEYQTEMKQSSIDFYLENQNALREKFIEGKFNGIEYFRKTLELEAETRKIHKQEITNAWDAGYDEIDRATASPIKYYHDTFNTKEE